ncbi:MAG: DUF6261 family protein [Flavobacteriaceae bacterium]|nr:DUF6261 family protein [Flavobacteriaceae bacterium]
MKEIKDITNRLMTNAAYFSFHSDFLKVLEADTKVSAKVNTQLQAYKTALAKVDEAMVISQKSHKTDEIAQADRERDQLYTGLKNAVKSYAHIPNEEMKSAQKVIAQVIKDYGIKTTMQLDKQTGLLVNFIQDLETKYTDEVSKLGLATFLTPLKVANEKVSIALSQRTEEQSTKEAGAMKSARNTTDEAYRLLVKHINAHALLEGETNYMAFIDFANEHIGRFKKNVLK